MNTINIKIFVKTHRKSTNRNKIVDLHIARYLGRCDEKSLSNIIVALQQRKRRKTKHRNKINDNLMAWHCARESEEKGKKSTRFSSTLGKDKGESFQFPWFRPVFEITPRPWAFLSKKRTHVPPFILRLYLRPVYRFFLFFFFYFTFSFSTLFFSQLFLTPISARRLLRAKERLKSNAEKQPCKCQKARVSILY